MDEEVKQLKDILKELNARIVVDGIAYCIESIVRVEGRTLLIPGAAVPKRKSRAKEAKDATKSAV